MRKKLLYTPITCFFLGIFLMNSVFALDYVLGARAGFFFWRPFYKDLPSGSGFEDIRTAGPLVSIGLRFQFLRNQFYKIETSGDGPDDRWMNDYLYGVFVTVMYVL